MHKLQNTKKVKHTVLRQKATQKESLWKLRGSKDRERKDDTELTLRTTVTDLCVAHFCLDNLVPHFTYITV